MSERTQEAQTSPSDLLSMSDEQIADLDLSFLEEEAPASSQPEAHEEEGEDDHLDQDDAAGDGAGDPDVGDELGDDAESESDADDDAAEDEGDDADAAEGEEAEGPESEDGEADADESDGEDEQTDAPVDYEAEYKKLFAPFKANGREMQVDNAEDARALMQMGANYNKKMAALKPNLKVLKLLENNNLLSEEKLSFLIDLEKKNPDAIMKLVKESGLDPLDMDLEKESEYKPSTYTVDDRELALDAVLEEIQHTPTYSKTVAEVSNKWDGPSKQEIANQPEILKVINDHMARGIYDRISTEVEKQRMLGRLNGLSDLEAYRQVGDTLNARGAFDDLAQDPATSRPEPVKKTVTPKPKAEDPKRKEKKRAASSTRSASPTSEGPEINPLALSDEEFEKLVKDKYV